MKLLKKYHKYRQISSNFKNIKKSLKYTTIQQYRKASINQICKYRHISKISNQIKQFKIRKNLTISIKRDQLWQFIVVNNAICEIFTNAKFCARKFSVKFWSNSTISIVNRNLNWIFDRLWQLRLKLLKNIRKYRQNSRNCKNVTKYRESPQYRKDSINHNFNWKIFHLKFANIGTFQKYQIK